MQSIAQRLDADRRRLRAMMSSDLTAQVAFLLLDHAEPDQHSRLVVRLSHEVIAQLLAARRQSVSRVLGELRQRGLLDTGYRQTVLLHPDQLEAVAGSSLPVWDV
jgi:CRP-like cAMP-binding protein